MLRKTGGPLSVMGFARYEKRAGVETARLIDAALTWQETFLRPREGILFHAFLGNLNGGFADIIFARDDKSFDAMLNAHMEAPSSEAFMALLSPDSIRLSRHRVLKPVAAPPSDFSCVEFGTFEIAENMEAGERDVLAISERIETDYLSRSDNTRLHFIGMGAQNRFCEVTFGRSLGETKRLCEGYVGHPTCQPLLDVCDPASLDLDFWFVLA
ncbi:hypothetical protein [uncultured Nitratireductor sp.]|uniref:hypothetical protein n=1 Tax=uncultured Nitratireductor sp. TaxID=520953 RepID=UPI0025D2B087|nr:hypothetical protein [uncultured Nitratireductor sp.]